MGDSVVDFLGAMLWEKQVNKRAKSLQQEGKIQASVGAPEGYVKGIGDSWQNRVWDIGPGYMRCKTISLSIEKIDMRSRECTTLGFFDEVDNLYVHRAVLTDGSIIDISFSPKTVDWALRVITSQKGIK